MIFFLIAVFSLARAYVGPTYVRIPRPGAIASFKADLDAADQNMANNERLSEHLERAAQGLIGLLSSMALCGILYVVDVLRVL